MTPSQFVDRSRVSFLALGAVICVAAALALQEYFSRTWGGGPRGYFTMLLAQGISAAVWIGLVPVVIRPLVRHLPVSSPGLLAHALAGAVIAVAHTLIVSTLFASYFYGWSPLAIRDVFRDRMHTAYAWSVFTYLLIVGAMLLWRSARAAPPAADAQPAERYLRRVLVKSSGRMTLVSAEQIAWIEAADNNVKVHAGSTTHEVRGPLARFAERLDPGQFVRVHRSAIVNLDRVREVQTWFAGELVAILTDDTRVTIGRTYRDKFLEALEG